MANDLAEARDLLSQPAADLTHDEGERVNALLNDVNERVTGVPASLIGWIPIVSANLDALDAVSGSVPPVVDRALELRDAADELARQGLLRDGRVDLAAIEELRPAVQAEAEALRDLEEALEANKNGKLAPPIWTAVDDLAYEVADISRDVRALDDLLGHAGGMLGANGERTYLILLMNNAELRGAGGILTGIGQMSADDGKLRISGFKSIHKLRTQKKNEVPVPEDFERFRIYGANDTSLFLNATYSPDVADVGLVSSRLYEEITGTATDGAMVVDPRGIAALMPPDATLRVPRSDRTVTTEELADFVYSDAYVEFTDQDERRNAILNVGERAFDVILDSGLDGEDALERAADAFSGGHIRFVSFDEGERSALDAVDVAGDLEPVEGDSLLVAVQNRGSGRPGIGSKLDFWERRRIEHDCAVRADEEEIECVTAVALRNEAPTGLPSYVTGGGKPYGAIHSFLEILIPAEAEITGLERDGREPGVVIEEQADRMSVGLSVVVERGDTTTVEVGYTLPYRGRYSFVATPQPLARDASIDIELALPTDWTVRGPGRWEDNTFRYQTTFVEPISISAGPSDRSGLPALWESLTDFWSEPLL
ncbi:MAG: DUF4012 domain-containing protein [Actinomycetota bacterium]|nr:DUF4012 domain-containing protein [Actinomycetota bacterium]